MFSFPHELVLAIEVGSLRPLTLDLTRRNSLQGVSRPIVYGWVVIGEIGLGMRGGELVAWLRDTTQLSPVTAGRALDFPATTIVAGTLSAMIIIMYCSWHPNGNVQELETELVVIRHTPAL